MFEIEKDVPIPEKANLQTKYPFRDLEVGDSFFVPFSESGQEEGAKTTPQKYLVSTILQASRRFKKNGEQYTCRSDRKNKGVRCWRVE